MSTSAECPIFDFATASRIHFGTNSLEVLAEAVAGWGPRVGLVTGAHAERSEPIRACLRHSGRDIEAFSIEREPTLEDLEAALARARSCRCDGFVAFGGGSVIDAAKVLAALSPTDQAILEHLEVVGHGRPLIGPGVPLVAVPTTAGTGAEVTRNAVVDVPQHRRKVSLRSIHLLPTRALVDPTWTLSLPAEWTAATGLDALTQVLEPFVSPAANPLTDGFCRTGLRAAAQGLPAAVADGNDLQARSRMALASLCGGLALANAKLGAVHGLAGPLGGLLHAPHGAICGALLVEVTRANLAGLRRQAPTHEALARYDELGCLLTGKPDAGADDAVAWLEQLCHRLPLRRLGEMGLSPGDCRAVAEAAGASSSMRGNPVSLSADQLEAVLRAAL